MAETFNPHHVWLGIQPHEMPPTHYRLLGIAQFEQSTDVICSAADRQMAHLRTFQTGPRAAACQKLLTEVSAAAACLLDAKRKTAYDSALRSPFDAAPVPRFTPAPRKPQSSPIATMIQVVAGGALGVSFAVLVLAYFFGVDLLGWQKREVAKSPPPKVAVAKAKAIEPAAATIPAVKPPAAEPPPRVFVPPAELPPAAEPVKPAPAQAPEPEPPANLASLSADEIFLPPVVQPTPPPTVAAAEPQPPKPIPKSSLPPGDVLEIYNTHNWKYGDSGAKTCNISLRNGKKILWQQDGIALSWDAKENAKTVVQLPAIKYLSIRIEITEAYGQRAGLADVAVLRNGKNITIGSPVIASEQYSGTGQCSPAMINDGAGDIGDGQGYWLLKGNTGWAEILAGIPPRSRR